MGFGHVADTAEAIERPSTGLRIMRPGSKSDLGLDETRTGAV
jgi:hypothetical protein